MLVRVNSHRARSKLEAAIGRAPQGYFMWDAPGEWREITDDEYALVRDITGVTRARIPDPSKLRQYVNW
jgi:hypothetical protein